MPLVMAKVAMEEIQPGDAIVVLATDPEASIDLAAWAADEGYALVERAAAGWTELALHRSAPQ
jgi:TusA-related sulfurtransferase